MGVHREMRNFKSHLLAATIIAGMAATSLQAQVAIPAPGPNDGDNSLHGAGATSIQNVLVQELNCIGADNQLGTSGGATGGFSTIAGGAYVPGSPSASNPIFTCTSHPNPDASAEADIQANFSGKYIATGSGFGRQMWSEFKDKFHGAVSGINGVHNPFNEVSGQSRWSNLQFAFSDTPIKPSDVTTYNSNALANGAGAAIQFPKYVLPVAVAYNPVYGKNASAQNMTFNVKTPGSINGTVAGGLRMTRDMYCKIFSGKILNWNDNSFKTVNSGSTLQDTANDTAARWAAEGVPIRLVGRLDRSGTTDVFSRHLAQVCTGVLLPQDIKFTNNAESLPYNSGSGVDLSSVRSDTGYQPSTPPGKLAGTTNMVSGDYFNGSAIVHVNGPSSTPTQVGAGLVNGSGLFLLGDGSGKVRDAINFAPDFAAASGVTLNGKVGYIGGDFIKPSPGASLFAAQLQVGTSATYAMPSASNAVAAFGSGAQLIVPPESNSTGAFLTGDTRTVQDATNTNVAATRDNPIAWTDVLYNSPNNNLAAPVKGYPITGTTQYFGYTCYKNANNRWNIVEFLGLNFGKITKTDTNAALSANTFKGSGATSLGTLAQSNIGVVPTAWQNAIVETFLKKSTQSSGGVVLGTKNLWIQDVYLLKATEFDAINQASDSKANPGCTAGQGA